MSILLKILVVAYLCLVRGVLLLTDRHAYMIMAHTNYNQLAILIQTIDDIRNDIYLHIDKTNPLTEIEKNSLLSASKQSNLFFIKSRSVSWGADSLMNVEIALLDEAVKRPHKYYHLLGNDPEHSNVRDYR